MLFQKLVSLKKYDNALAYKKLPSVSFFCLCLPSSLSVYLSVCRRLRRRPLMQRFAFLWLGFRIRRLVAGLVAGRVTVPVRPITDRCA